MVRRYPAILIGGPPNSGKSTLSYRLGATLRRKVKLYIMRASPDGEGNWSSEAPQDIVRELRARTKRGWTRSFADLVTSYIGQRHLPLLVDVGGLPSAEVEQIVTQCTGALLLASNLNDLAPWRELLMRQNVPLLYELRSDLHGVQEITAPGPPMRGVITGLQKGMSSDGPCFDLLVSELAQLFWLEPATLARSHATMTDVEPFLNLEAQIGTLPAHTLPDTPWRPDEIPEVVAGLKPKMPLALYGVAPLWLYAALSAFAHPARCVLFNVALGWVEPPPLTLATAMDPARLRWDAVELWPEYTHLKLSIPPYYLDYAEVAGTPVPHVPMDRGVVLDGKLPNWLYAALVRVYADAAWIGVFEPRPHRDDAPGQRRAVVVHSQRTDIPLGSTYLLT